MVPHRNMLRILALLAYGRPGGRATALAKAQDLSSRFPVDLDEFMDSEVYPHIPGPLAVRLQTSDAAVDAQAAAAAHDAASQLGLGQYLAFETSFSLKLVLPSAIREWRSEKSMRVFIETCALVGIPSSLIAADLSRLWGWDYDEGDIEVFRRLFADRQHLRGPGWGLYEAVIGSDEASFKRGLLSQPHDFVRWRLGVPIEMDNDRVLDRLMSDAYYTERLIKSEAGEMGVNLSKDQMARLKMERDTLFKAMDRKVKIREAEAEQGGGRGEDAANILASITLKYDREEETSRVAARTLSDLLAENEETHASDTSV